MQIYHLCPFFFGYELTVILLSQLPGIINIHHHTRLCLAFLKSLQWLYVALKIFRLGSTNQQYSTQLACIRPWVRPIKLQRKETVISASPLLPLLPSHSQLKHIIFSHRKLSLLCSLLSNMLVFAYLKHICPFLSQQKH